MSEKTTFYLGAALHVLILFLILTAFFELVISKVAKDAFDHELKSTIHDALDDNLSAADSSTNQQLCYQLKSNKNILDPFEKMFSKPDSNTETYNSWLLRTAKVMAFFIGLLVILFYVVLKESCGVCSNMGGLLAENAIVFLFVGMIEYAFFMYIAKKFVPVAPSYLVTKVTQNLKDQVCDKNYCPDCVTDARC